MIDFVRMRLLIRQTKKAKFEVEKAQARATLSGVQYSSMPKGGNSGDKMQRDVITMTEVKDAYRQIINELASMQQELRPYVDSLDDVDQRAVMRLRYFGCHSPQTIAQSNMLNMSRMTVYRSLCKGEDAIKQMLVLNDT